MKKHFLALVVSSLAVAGFAAPLSALANSYYPVAQMYPQNQYSTNYYPQQTNQYRQPMTYYPQQMNYYQPMMQTYNNNNYRQPMYNNQYNYQPTYYRPQYFSYMVSGYTFYPSMFSYPASGYMTSGNMYGW